MIDKKSTTETTPEEVEESEPENQVTSENENSEKTWEEKYNDTYDALLRAKAEVENINIMENSEARKEFNKFFKNLAYNKLKS